MEGIQDFLSNWLHSTEIPILIAFILGLLASVFPCNLGSNIVASAYISRQMDNRMRIVLATLLYALGRMICYTLVAVLIISIGIRAPVIKVFVENVSTYALVPLLIITGILMLIADKIPGFNTNVLSRIGNKVANRGLLGAFLLGFILALAFCPLTAMFYFGVLIPLALKSSGGVFLPIYFSIGIVMPAIIFGILLSLGASFVHSWLAKITKAERVIRIIVALIFIGFGLYYITLL
jgi:cytochrome c-type biogenesis protein